MNSILAPSCSGIFTFYTWNYITGKEQERRMDFISLTNGILAGLVSVTASCNKIEPASALVIGIFGSLTYSLACRTLNYLRIDDPLEAF